MVGRTFLFNDKTSRAADEADRWLGMLAEDAKMLAGASGERAFWRAAERLETVRHERLRKGRGKYRKEIDELIGAFDKQTEKLLAHKAGNIYPTVRAQLVRRMRAARRAVQARENVGQGVQTVLLMRGYPTMVREVASVTARYLDPSRTDLIDRIDALVTVLGAWERKAEVWSVSADEALLRLLSSEAMMTIESYRYLLAEMAVEEQQGTLLAIMPSGFLVWADSVCAFAQRALRRIARGKDTAEANDIDEEVEVAETRACERLPITIVAEQEAVEAKSNEAKPREEKSNEVQEDVQEAVTVSGEAATSQAEITPTVADVAVTDEAVTAVVPVERIYAKASDYKKIVAKMIHQGERQGVKKPRPLGKHQ